MLEEKAWETRERELIKFSHVSGKFHRRFQNCDDPKGQVLLEKLPHNLPPQFSGQTGWVNSHTEKNEKRQKHKIDSYLPVSGCKGSRE